jgi:Flp pilus assembly protein TadG
VIRRARDDRGAAAVELAALLPVFVLFFGLVVFWGRHAEGQATTDAAARWAARTLSIARDPADAAAAAQADAAATVGESQASCASMGFEWSATATEVTVTLSCSVDTSELLLLPFPGTSTITSTAVEVRDQYRENAP